jgi:hypothetical protein
MPSHELAGVARPRRHHLGRGAVTGIKPKGTRHVAHTRRMGMARLALLVLMAIFACLAFRARAGG